MHTFGLVTRLGGISKPGYPLLTPGFSNFLIHFSQNSHSRVSPVQREIIRHNKSVLYRINQVFHSKEYPTKETTRENKLGANAETAMLI